MQDFDPADVLLDIAEVMHVGICKRGSDDRDGLRVIDASSMPDIISGNTNVSAMMNPEKGLI